MSKKAKLVTAMSVLAVIGLAGYWLYSVTHKPVPVNTVKLVRGELKVTVTATTTSTIESEREVTVSARRTGTVSKLPVEEGDAVSAGQMICELDRADVEAELGQARANLVAAERQLAVTKAGVSMQKAQASAAVAESESVLGEASRDLERYTVLFGQGIVSRQDVDAAKRAFEVAKARYDTAVAGLDVAQVKDSEVDAAEAAVGQARAAVDVVKVQVGYSYINAPVDGVISKLHVELGETVGMNSPVAELVDPRDIYVQSTIDEVDVSKLAVGMPVKISVDALPERLYDGTINRISPIVFGEKQETRTFEVRVRFNEELKFLKPGMSADIEVLSKKMDDVLHLPAQSIVDREGAKFVYRVEDATARLVPVKTGYLSWSDAEITEGLSEGDIVITTPDASGLTDGVKVVEME